MRVALMSSVRAVPEVYSKSAEEILGLHGGNTGNVAFVNALSSHLRGQVTPVSWDASPDQLKAAGDIVVIASANQLGPHTDLAKTADNLDKAGLPIVAIGLGAQADSQDKDVELKPGTRRWVEVIGAHAPSSQPNIGVRGAYTLQQIEKLGIEANAAVTGCPSNFTTRSFDYVAAVEQRLGREITHIAGAIGHPFTPSLGPVEREILDLIDATQGTCPVQHGLSMLKLAMNEFDSIDPALLEQSRRYFRPTLTMKEFKEWCRRRLVVHGDADTWMASLRRYDFVVGPRFHGVMLAIQAGVPGGCVAHDSRTLEMCQTMEIPVRMYDTLKEPLTRDNLAKSFPFDGAKYRKTRAKLAGTYLSILDAAGLKYDPRLKGMVEPLAKAA